MYEHEEGRKEIIEEYRKGRGRVDRVISVYTLEEDLKLDLFLEWTQKYSYEEMREMNWIYQEFLKNREGLEEMLKST